MNKIIIVDIDDTIVDVTERMRYVLKELGFDVEGLSKAELNDIVDSLEGEKRNKFFKKFLDDKLVYLDEVNEEVLRFLYNYQQEKKVPIVIITGRPGRMQSTFDIIDTMKEFDFDIRRIHVRGDHLPAVYYKNVILKRYAYDPIAIFDDDKEILDLMKELYPKMEAYWIDDGKVRRYD